MVVQKNKIIFNKLVFILACLFLLFWSLYYYSLNNIYIMVITISFILYQSLQVKELRFDINLCFLMETFFVKAMLDQHTGKAAMVPTTIALPMISYLFGKLLVVDNQTEKSNVDSMFSKEKRAFMSIGAITIGVTILGILNYRLLRKLSLVSTGYYPVAFTNNAFFTNKLTFLFNFIFLTSWGVAIAIWVFYKMTDKLEKQKKAQVRLTFISLPLVLALIVGIAMYVKTENYLAFKEGVYFIITKHWGNFGLDLTHNNSTSNMWLDYGRDYGILVFITLFIFLLLTVKDALKLAMNNEVNIFIKSWVLILFIIINVYYFVDATAYVYQGIWYLGLVVCGVLSEMSNWSCK